MSDWLLSRDGHRYKCYWEQLKYLYDAFNRYMVNNPSYNLSTGRFCCNITLEEYLENDEEMCQEIKKKFQWELTGREHWPITIKEVYSKKIYAVVPDQPVTYQIVADY